MPTGTATLRLSRKTWISITIRFREKNTMLEASDRSTRKATLPRIVEVTNGVKFRNFSLSQIIFRSWLAVKKRARKALAKSIQLRLCCTRMKLSNLSLLITIGHLILMALRQQQTRTNFSTRNSMGISPYRLDPAILKFPHKSSASAFSMPKIRGGTACRPRQLYCQTRLKVMMNTTL